MKFNAYIFFLLFLGLTLGSCERLVDGINDNPNKITTEAVDARLMLTGAMLANVGVQAGHLQRIASSWSGHLIGFQSLYKTLYEYNITSAETDGTWTDAYHGVITQLRFIREAAPEDELLIGISKVLEAHTVGTLAALHGDIPYAEVLDPAIDDPAFDAQAAVYAALQSLLDEALAALERAPNGLLAEDIYLQGDRMKWMEAAWTLKARYFLQTKNYAEAYEAARNGISGLEGNVNFFPIESDNTSDKNLYFTLLAGSRAGDIGTGNSYLMQLLDAAAAPSRNHAKTQEAARRRYLRIDEGSATANLGVAGRTEPMRLITHGENLLILAEAGTRTEGLATGLAALNAWRSLLNSGTAFKVLNAQDALRYEAFEVADFEAGGLENPDGLAPERALLREIIEERYVSGFGSFISFNDARRLRKSDGDLAVPFPLNISSATRHPERFIVANDELNANTHAPEDPGIYATTPVNR